MRNETTPDFSREFVMKKTFIVLVVAALVLVICFHSPCRDKD